MPFLEVAGGALIGGGVSLGTTLLVEARKAKADLRKEERIQQRELLQALRLLEAECRLNRSTLKVIREREDGPWYHRPIQTSAWKTYEASIALHPDQGLWNKVNLFYTAILIAENVNQEEGHTKAARELLDDSCKMAEDAMTALQDAIKQAS